MSNKIRALRLRSGISLEEVADMIGADLAHIALAELGIGIVPFHLGVAIASALSVHPGDLFPGTRAIFDEIDAMSENDMYEVAALSGHSATLTRAGVDPDLVTWYAVVRFGSLTERNYPVSSVEADRLRAVLSSESVPPFLSFLSDCRTVVIRVSSVSEIRFTTDSSHVPFTSDRAFEVTLITRTASRPERLDVLPDGGEDGAGARPFGTLLARVESPYPSMPAFIPIESPGGDERLGAADTIDAIEIPVGVVRPSIYDESLPPAAAAPADLNGMEMMGTA